MNHKQITKACIEAMSNDKLNELKSLIIAEQIKRMKEERTEHVSTCTTCQTPLSQMMICPIHIAVQRLY